MYIRSPSSFRATLFYIKVMERKSHPVGVDSVKSCGNSGGPFNMEKRVVAISPCVSEFDKVGGSRD